MAQMGVTISAGDFGAFHPEFIIRFLSYGFGADRLEKAGPAGAALELGVHIIERRTAADAVKNPIDLGKILMATGAFGAAFLGYFISKI
jgi:hypothetical protein